MTLNPYVILEVSKDAGDDQIKKAYRKLAKQYHPDVNRNDPAAEKKFKDIGEAYRILSDKQARQAYDKQAQAQTQAGRTQQPRRSVADEAAGDGFDIANMAQGMQSSFERYFGYDPHTGRVTHEDKLNPNAKKPTNPLDATAMFNSFFSNFKK